MLLQSDSKLQKSMRRCSRLATTMPPLGVNPNFHGQISSLTMEAHNRTLLCGNAHITGTRNIQKLDGEKKRVYSTLWI